MSGDSAVGVCGVGHPGDPLPGRTRPELCASVGHPYVTHNPWHDQSWCLCGAIVSPGQHVDLPKPTTHPGPLWECWIDGCPCHTTTTGDPT